MKRYIEIKSKIRDKTEGADNLQTMAHYKNILKKADRKNLEFQGL